MREILFRGKSICADYPSDISHNYWTEGSLVHQTEHYGDPVNVYHIIKLGEFHEEFYGAEEVWPETLGQYTGLKDKNGKKIFEGDIVRSDDIHGEPLLVIFNEGCATFQVLFKDGYSEGFLERYSDINHLEVVGNIHDNPDLFKGE